MISVMPKEYSLSDERAIALGELFARKRREAGYERQSDAAADIGVSQDLISRTERNFTINMRIGDLGVIMQRYKIAPNEVFELMGLYDPAIKHSSEKKYIDGEILPLLSRLNRTTLSLIRNIVKNFVDGEKTKPPTP